MKKNITINLAGQLFAIDEDAYQLLFNYTETLRRFYRRQDEGEEVVDDIEARIAELFVELQTQGYNAITIEHVQSVIERIGSLEDITGTNSETRSRERAENLDDAAAGAAEALHDAAGNAADSVRGAWNKVRGGKRFYRDMENKFLFGVLAGCSRYFGGDVTIWRIVFLVLMFAPLPFIGHSLNGLGGVPFILYIVMAIVAPAASTPEERLKMRGEEVTPQNLAGEVKRESTETNANAARAQRRQTMNMIAAVLLILFSVWMWLGLLGVICGSGVLCFMPEFIKHQMYHAESMKLATADANAVIFSILYILLAVGVCLFVMAYASMHAGLSFLGKVKAMGLKERLVWLLVWALSIVGITIAGVNCASAVAKVEEKYGDRGVEMTEEMNATPADSTQTAAADTTLALQPTDTTAVATPFK